MLKLREILEQVITNHFKHLPRVLVLHVTRSNVKRIVRTKVLIVLMLRHLVLDFDPKRNSSLVAPAPRNVADSVTTTTKEQ